MARNRLDASIPASISNILQNLSNRPNVQSTLILSRKDGSIICATGELSADKPATIAPRSDVGQRNAPSTGEEQVLGPVDDEQTQSYSPTPAESLASSIFDFVRIATTLAAALGGSHNDDVEQSLAQAGSSGTSSTNGKTDEPNPEDETEDTSTDSQIQLLRMRTKKQEIIIFPDLSYLCCVVQAAGKNHTGIR